ncbi:hypothetical protein RIF29_20595 [Crotalaria pallida]|uniref:Uncharacterized protein n=1 Tax=Crotalaria pallida TaxID=3830 RepID=A0AAN9F1I7_CROPI
MVRGRRHLHPLSRSHLPYLPHSHHYTDENRGGHLYQPLKLPWQITPLPSLNVEDRYGEDNIWARAGASDVAGATLAGMRVSDAMLDGMVYAAQAGATLVGSSVRAGATLNEAREALVAGASRSVGTGAVVLPGAVSNKTGALPGATSRPGALADAACKGAGVNLNSGASILKDNEI